MTKGKQQQQKYTLQNCVDPSRKQRCTYQTLTTISQFYLPIMQRFLLKFNKHISIFPGVNQWFLQTNQKVLHFFIFSK